MKEKNMKGRILCRLGVLAVALISSGCASTVKGAEERAEVTSAVEAKVMKCDFETSRIGTVPKGWSVARTGAGEGSDWKIAEDLTAPNGTKVLAQTAESPSSTFNLCVADNTSFKDVEVSVAFKAVSGKKDQGGGVIWRYKDENNYYIARFNPLEDNYRFYKVVAGKRLQLTTKEGLKAPAGEWHTLTIQMKGDTIVCLLNAEKQLEEKDATFDNAGKVGLWTKADAQTYFDGFEARELTK
jgi:hypothetical protein